MAKTSGLAWQTLTIQDSTATSQDIRNDVTNLDFATPQAMLDMTGIDKSAIERLLLLSDFSLNLNGVWNNSLTGHHQVFRTIGLGTTAISRATSLTVSGSNLTGINVIYSEYNVIRGNDGSLKWTASGMLADGATPTWS